jgi:hypothetical protein
MEKNNKAAIMTAPPRKMKKTNKPWVSNRHPASCWSLGSLRASFLLSSLALGWRCHHSDVRQINAVPHHVLLGDHFSHSLPSWNPNAHHVDGTVWIRRRAGGDFLFRVHFSESAVFAGGNFELIFCHHNSKRANKWPHATRWGAVRLVWSHGRRVHGLWRSAKKKKTRIVTLI